MHLVVIWLWMHQMKEYASSSQFTLATIHNYQCIISVYVLTARYMNDGVSKHSLNVSGVVPLEFLHVTSPRAGIQVFI